MKKTLNSIVAVAVAALTLSLTGCQKDFENLIIGTWNEDESTVTHTIDNDSPETYSALGEGETAEITFRADGTYTTVHHTTEGDVEKSGTWSIQKDKITLIADDGPMAYFIDKLNRKHCYLHGISSATIDYTTYYIHYSLKLTRM